MSALDQNLIRRVMRCWGKTGARADQFHPALYHMLDVAHVAQVLLGERASSRWRNVLAPALDADATRLVDWLPYFKALHDIGKVSVPFQVLVPDQVQRLLQEGFEFGVWKADWYVPHATVSQLYFEGVLQTASNTLTPLLRAFGDALGGHHGRFVHPDELKKAQGYLSFEPVEWSALRRVADEALKSLLFHSKSDELRAPSNLSAAIAAITGFCVVCDWLGSDQRYFQPACDLDLDEYTTLSQRQAEAVARDNGFLNSMFSTASVRMLELFADKLPLRPLQTAIDDVPDHVLQAPTLAIIEAPTGEGKTEAALGLARRIAQSRGTDELYYALPTMATSNQMFVRLQQHLTDRLGLAAQAKLVHGQAFLVEEELRKETPAAFMQPLSNGDSRADDAISGPLTWFNSKKRALLAPFGVGTVDQAELATLNVKHAALRLMSLAGKVVIVDEVHAYDVYMTAIIEQLLRWLRVLNASVVLLSATLPISRRGQLAMAFGITQTLTDEEAHVYPSLWVISSRGSHHASPAVWQPNRTMQLRHLHFGDEDAEAKAHWLLNAVVNGGCACWIANTVRRSQRIFKHLLRLAPSDVDLCLLHSQFPLDERQAREDNPRQAYGPKGNRHRQGIVVGTQVLEQSLDLDFDVMASDLAPVDLTLQRAGRLHRHDRARPSEHSAPVLWLNFSMTDTGQLQLGSDRSIYDEFIMRQTYAALASREQIALPRDYRPLIEAVYGVTDVPESNPLHEAWLKLKNKEAQAIGEANQRLLPAPHPRDSVARIAATRLKFEEDENRADWIVAQTRLGEETLNIIPLERDGDWARVPGLGEPINVRVEAPLSVQRLILRRNLRISHKRAIELIREAANAHKTPLFTRSALLKDYVPLWLKRGRATEISEVSIYLDPNLGLIVEKEGKVHDEAQ